MFCLSTPLFPKFQNFISVHILSDISKQRTASTESISILNQRKCLKSLLKYSRFHKRSSKPNVTIPSFSNVGKCWPSQHRPFAIEVHWFQVSEVWWCQLRFTGYMKLVLCKAADCLQLAELRDLIWVRLIKVMSPQPSDCFCSFKQHSVSAWNIKFVFDTSIPSIPAVVAIKTHTP